MPLFSKTDGKFIEIEGRSFQNERELQELFLNNPDLVPWEIDDRHVMVDEFPTDAGPIDNILLDATGQIMILETKLIRNSTRREVLAQIIDYASQLSRFGPQEFIDRFTAKLQYDFTESWFTTKNDHDTFRRVLESNLRNSHLTMMIVMDKAEPLLKDAVRLINRSTAFNCILVEVSVLVLDGKEMIHVETYGEEAADEKITSTGGASRSRSEPITEQDFIEAMKGKGLGTEAIEFIKAYKWAHDNGFPTREASKSYMIGSANNGLYWYKSYNWIEVWTPRELFEKKKVYLDTIPSTWKSRMKLRTKTEMGNNVLLAKINPKGATETEFKDLFTFIQNGPK